MLGAGRESYVPGMVAGGDMNESMMSVIQGQMQGRPSVVDKLDDL